MAQRGRFEGPADALRLDRLGAESRRVVIAGLVIALLAHAGLLAYLLISRTAIREAQPPTVEFVMRSPRLTKPFELKKKRVQRKMTRRRVEAEAVPDIAIAERINRPDVFGTVATFNYAIESGGDRGWGGRRAGDHGFRAIGQHQGAREAPQHAGRVSRSGGVGHRKIQGARNPESDKQAGHPGVHISGPGSGRGAGSADASGDPATGEGRQQVHHDQRQSGGSPASGFAGSFQGTFRVHHGEQGISISPPKRSAT